MTRNTGKRKHHYKDSYPKDPAIKSFGEWLPANQGFFKNFCTWLQDGGYSFSAVNIYGVAARLALGYLDKPYWTIDPDADLERMSLHLETRLLTPGTRNDYRKGLLKLAEYLRLRCGRPPRERPINWAYYLHQSTPRLAIGSCPGLSDTLPPQLASRPVSSIHLELAWEADYPFALDGGAGPA